MNYLTRMMTARDPRIRRLAQKIEAKRNRLVVSPEAEMEHLRNRYRRLTGKVADKRWSGDTLLARVLAAQDASPAVSDTRDCIAASLDSLENNP